MYVDGQLFKVGLHIGAKLSIMVAAVFIVAIMIIGFILKGIDNE